MNNKLSLTFILTLPLLLAIWFTNCAQDARAELEPVWVPLLGTDALEIGSLLSDGERLYAATLNGLYISDDDGSTWRPTELDQPYAYNILAIHQNTVYATAHPHGGFRSDDRGETWKPINNGLPLKFWDDGDSYYPSVKQILVTNSSTSILVAPYRTFTSTDRGETWRDVSEEWTAHESKIGSEIELMIEFDGYLWAATSTGGMLRSADKGQTWKWTRHFNHGRITDWEVFNDRLYAAGEYSFGRWNEAERAWEYFSESLETGTDEPHFTSLAVNRGRLFAGLRYYGVYMFDDRSETWIPAGLQEFGIAALVSHQSDLYAAAFEKIRNSTEPLGIYHASIPIIQPYGKAATTWGAVKQK